MLNELIETHKKAVTEFTKACEHLEENIAAQEEVEQGKEVFGLTAVRLHFDQTSLAEKAAVRAICAYRCSTIDEERERLRYIMGQPEIMQMIEDFTPLLMQAVAA